MNALKKLFGGGRKKKDKKEGDEQQRRDNEDEEEGEEHFETDFDRAFEEAAKKPSVTVPQIIDYRGSPSRTNRCSKSPSPYQSTQQPKSQHPIKKVSSAVSNRTPCRSRKGSAPGAYKLFGDAKGSTPEKELMRRKLTELQQKRAKDIVESLDWIKPTGESASPIIARTETICPQVHICEMLPLPRAVPPRQIVPFHSSPLATSGKLRISLTNSSQLANNEPKL